MEAEAFYKNLLKNTVYRFFLESITASANIKTDDQQLK